MTQLPQIMIADNRPAIRQGLKALLNQYPQITVIGEAADGQEIVQKAAELQPDVILMDMQMPVMDGLEATRLIKQSQPQIKIIALTLYNSYREEALAAGVDAFLLKGCTPECLMEAILSPKQMSQETVVSSPDTIVRAVSPVPGNRQQRSDRHNQP